VNLFFKSTKGNFQNFLSKSDIRLSYLLYYIAYILQLCFTHARKNINISIGEVTTKIYKLATEIMNPAMVLSIGSRCPIYSPTRFLHIVLTIQFIVEKEEQILEYAKKFQIFTNCFHFLKWFE
jgi:hypothetical protein